MSRLPSRFRRLDDILFDLPDDAMLLSELDGYLTGIVLSPDPVPSAEWLPGIWRGAFGESAPFEDPIDVAMFAAMVTARHDEIVRELARGKPLPIFDTDERNGDLLWELWMEGFETAMRLRPDSWPAADGDVGAAIDDLLVLAGIANNTTTLTSDQVNRLSDEAPGIIQSCLAPLYARRIAVGTPLPSPAGRSAKVGRNDPCPCGSGKKYKRCCGLG